MAGSFNKVIIMGNLTRDVELRYIPSGTAVTDLGIAVNEKRKNTNGDVIEETTFVDVTLWGRNAEVASKYLSKGSPVLIEGRLRLDQWENADGEKRQKMKVVCDRMQMVGGNPNTSSETAKSSGTKQEQSSEPVDTDDDIPF
jgi:single-strand DNA-binding protein